MTYYWTPVEPPEIPPERQLGLALIEILHKKHESIGPRDEYVVGLELNEQWLEWLRGVRDASTGTVADDAWRLICGINEAGTIRIEVDR